MTLPTLTFYGISSLMTLLRIWCIKYLSKWNGLYYYYILLSSHRQSDLRALYQQLFLKGGYPLPLPFYFQRTNKLITMPL